MSHRYAPLPNPRTDDRAQSEMEAAFNDDDDGDDDDSQISQSVSEARPLNPSSNHPGTYDFENVDYDCPPPGSPTAPSTFAVPNNHGNSNGILPTSVDPIPHQPERTWLQRTAAAVLPSRIVDRLGFPPRRPIGVVGSGIGNDGVFANVTAKPSRLVQVQEEGSGDNMYLVPEESRADVPPSYAHAQADAVPPYWETTVHAPFSSDGVGEMIVDFLPTGTLFSFLWNMLISISFQLVGFLLTYLLHTTHAARLGSRAGLGVTLIQYGFALRGKADGDVVLWSSDQSPSESMPNAAEANEYRHMPNGTTPYSDPTTTAVATAATEWLSFFLMTIGWFILLTSILSFWRVKHWERGIIASHRENSPQSTAPTSSRPTHSAILSMLTFPGSHIPRPRHSSEPGTARTDSREREYDRSESNDRLDLAERALMIPVAPTEQPTAHNVQATFLTERQLQADLRAAGLI